MTFSAFFSNANTKQFPSLLTHENTPKNKSLIVERRGKIIKPFPDIEYDILVQRQRQLPFNFAQKEQTL